MSINSKDLRDVIQLTLKRFASGKYYSEDAVELLMMTAAHESYLGTYLRQVGGGPARGIFQMEPATARDIYKNYLKYKPELLKEVDRFRLHDGGYELDTEGNLPYQIVMARVHFLRDRYPIPPKIGTRTLAQYYKRVWNTYLGKATIEQVIEDYERYV